MLYSSVSYSGQYRPLEGKKDATGGKKPKGGKSAFLKIQKYCEIFVYLRYLQLNFIITLY